MLPSRITSKPVQRTLPRSTFNAPDSVPYVGNGLPSKRRQSAVAPRKTQQVVFIQDKELKTSGKEENGAQEHAPAPRQTRTSVLRSSRKKEVDIMSIPVPLDSSSNFREERSRATSARVREVLHFDVAQLEDYTSFHRCPSQAVLSRRPSQAVLSRRSSQAPLMGRPSKAVLSRRSSEALWARRDSKPTTERRVSHAAMALRTSQSTTIRRASQAPMTPRASQGAAGTKSSQGAITLKNPEEPGPRRRTIVQHQQIQRKKKVGVNKKK